MVRVSPAPYFFEFTAKVFKGKKPLQITHANLIVNRTDTRNL